MSGLPSGWANTTLGEITTDCAQKTPADEEQFLYIDIASVDKEKKAILAPQQLVGKDAPSRARKLVATGDVLVSMTRPNLNAVALVPSQYNGEIASTGFDVLRPRDVDSRWLFYTVRSTQFIERMSEAVQGALYPAVRGKDIRGFDLPLAPLPEQKLIADKLDSMLARVDACRDRLDRLPALLKRFRQSILAAATSGRLTEDWREAANIVTHSWKSKPLKELCSRVSVGHVGETSKYYTTPSNGVPFLRSQNVRPGRVALEGLAYITQEFHQRLKKSQLQAGDLLIVRVGANRGDSCVLPAGFSEINCANIVFARPTDITPSYLNLYFQSPSCQDDMLGRTVGGAQGVINTGSVEQILVPVPTPEEQHEIVRRVETLFAFADRLEARLGNARAQVGKLTPALLAKAFRGELVPQDPADEPASELLKRLAAARAEAPKPKRGRKSAD